MKTPAYQERLKKIAPSVYFNVSFTYDRDARWPKCCGENTEDLVAYNSDVSASAIIGGVYLEGNGYLGGSWWPDGEPDPEINGYLPQKLLEAALDLKRQIEKWMADMSHENDQETALMAAARIWSQLRGVDLYLEKILKLYYDEQQKEESK